jgi:thiol-disulfide isomerase/thioredoxin
MKVTVVIISIVISTYIGIAQTLTDSNIKVVNFDQFEPYLKSQSDTLYLINFWATWCSPCIKELPAIDKVGEKYKNEKFKIVLVSLDMPKELNTRLKTFVKNKNIQSEVILLDDPNQNRWIDLVDPKWSGEIPFTILYRKNSREFFPRSFTFSELDSIIHLKINQP